MLSTSSRLSSPDNNGEDSGSDPSTPVRDIAERFKGKSPAELDEYYKGRQRSIDARHGCDSDQNAGRGYDSDLEGIAGLDPSLAFEKLLVESLIGDRGKRSKAERGSTSNTNDQESSNKNSDEDPD